MSASYANIQKRLKAFDFKGLFTQELMWNHFQTRDLEVPVDGFTYILRPVAQRGMAVYECVPPTDASFPKYAIRRKIDTQVSKTAREHIIIFHDHAESVQIWQWVKREAGKSSECREQVFYSGQTGDALIQKIQSIAFTLEDDANIAATVEKVGTAFDVEKVTKRFYELFRKEHDTFLKCIEGIPNDELEKWYVSVMLNRLMFIYFIQKKGFLGGDQHYLTNKLTESKRRGKGKFYREFLCRLFFEGFAKPPQQRSAETNSLLGQVPYLNGGLFLKHQIEELYGKTIVISDKAFDRVFAFFEKYDWHLDDRPTRKGNEINPDVLGYVFEKYINQKEMGAYYTREDITEYISRNTIIPTLFDMVREDCNVVFHGEHSIWRLLQSDPDRYIPLAIQAGLEKELPQHIAAGLSDTKNRDEWNKTADVGYRLPTETWREVVSRRNLCTDLRGKLASGQIASISDLVTYNIDLRRLAEDIITDPEHGPELVWAFYKALGSISVLDPTCGSGAFLFAALNVLEPLYNACVYRMEQLVNLLNFSADKHGHEKLSHFKRVLRDMHDTTRHPSPRYFILKSIILKNLYGVDLMEEATEICKLRLFLKLVAQVNPGDQIEPLPDIDFNIRSGNTLVGYATKEQLDKALSRLGHAEKKQAIDAKADAARHAFDRFRDGQVASTASAHDVEHWKADVQFRLAELRDELDDYLSGEYNIKRGDKGRFGAWRACYRPFHWYVECFGIMHERRFDVIIGNPPYVEYTKKNKDTKKSVQDIYQIRGYVTEPCDDLYAFVLERCQALLADKGAFGMIVPVSIVSTDGFKPLRQVMLAENGVTWTLNFAERPSKLFSGVEKRLTIWISKRSEGERQLFGSRYRRWLSEERNPSEPATDALFSIISFVPLHPREHLVADSIPKIGTILEASILRKLAHEMTVGTQLAKSGDSIIYYTRKLRYFVQFFDFVPEIRDSHNRKLEPSELKDLITRTEDDKAVLLCCLNSSLFFWFFTAFSDVRNVNRREIEWFRFSLNLLTPEMKKSFLQLANRLMVDFKKNSQFIVNNYKKCGVLKIQSFQPRLSKPVIDEIDEVVAVRYGFTPEEVDFIINFDHKYRLGQDEDEGESMAVGAN